jgi:hypothetical protein
MFGESGDVKVGRERILEFFMRKIKCDDRKLYLNKHDSKTIQKRF